MTIIININGNLFNVEPNISVLQACEIANIVIPRFCYHERLSVAGNCRMCLVEVEKMPKLQVSCSIPVMPNMVVKTESPSVKKAREGVLEFLLINHPLDCPICDQGGECDLQDQSLIYGGDRSRFREFKRATEDKNCGPLIKTVMTRCIHCTRCVRFANEVLGIPAFGTSGRGNSLEIGTYVNKMISSELSGNIIDLCPVGALTSKPYAFLSRPWELKSTESIDIFDSLHSNIRIDTRGYDIMRILPRLNESINEEWISDKARFSFDGLLVQRLTVPLVKNKEGLFNPISWNSALDLITSKLNTKTASKNLTFFPGDLCDVETLLVLKNFTLLANAKIVNHSFESYINSDYQTFFKFNTLIKNIIKADLCLLIGVNPKIEGPILNYHLRKRFLLGNFNVVYIGSQLKLSFPTVQLGNSFSSLVSVLEGSSNFCKSLKRSKRPIVIFGRSFQSYLKDNNLDLAFTILSRNNFLVNNLWSGLNYFNTYTSNFAFYNFSLNNSFYCSKETNVLYAVEYTKPLKGLVNYNYLIYQGHHGCLNAQKADLILPSNSVMEKNSLYMNCEGRLQYSQSASLGLNLAKPSAHILETILNISFNFKKDFSRNEYFSIIDSNIRDFIPFSNLTTNLNTTSTNFFNLSRPLYSNLIIQNSYVCSSLFDNFYHTDIISENSMNMTRSSKILLDKNPFNF